MSPRAKKDRQALAGELGTTGLSHLMRLNTTAKDVFPHLAAIRTLHPKHIDIPRLHTLQTVNEAVHKDCCWVYYSYLDFVYERYKALPFLAILEMLHYYKRARQSVEELCRQAALVCEDIKEHKPEYSTQAWMVYDKCEEIRELLDEGLEAEEYLQKFVQEAEEENGDEGESEEEK